jgi:GGDEF domain-containing protein/ActR/RegA family two-component response regulator
LTSRITLGPPLVGAPTPTDAPLSVAYGERHGEGARRVTVLAVVNEEAAGLFHRVLSRDRLVVANDLAEAIAMAEAEAPEAVFVDVGVADGAGLALVHHIKVVAPGATIFALATTQGVEAGAHAVALGAAGLFILPLGGDELLNAVHAVRARLVERAARGQLMAELRAHSRATDWIRRMVELVEAPDWEIVASEVADVLVEATFADGAAVYVARDERDGEFAQRAATPELAKTPLFGTEAELIEHARRESLTVVRLATRKQAVGLVLLAPSRTQESGLSSSARGASLDGIVRMIAMQAATAFALRVERERAANGALMKDPASSAYSFAYYVDVAGREIDRARRHGRRFSIATVVLDAGKPGATPETSVQIESGPRAAEVGDRLLSAVSDIDVVARIDEDEFHLLLPETEGLGAHAVRRRILARLGSASDRRPVPRGVLVGMATFPHDGRDLAQLLRVARRRADRTARSIVHALPSEAIGLAELAAAALPGQAVSAADLFAPRSFTLAAPDAAALAAAAVQEAMRGGSVLVAVADHKGLALGAAVRAVLGAGREGVQLHAVDTSGAPGARDVEALAVLAEHGAFALVGRNGGEEIQGFHAADPLLADLVADRIGRAGGVRVLG